MTIDKLFNTEYDDISLSVVEKYFEDPFEESTTLEYKSHSLLKHQNFKHIEGKVIKTICAFLNSEGGVVIWGAPRESKDKEGHKGLGTDLCPVDKVIIKDHFVSKILGNIFPQPNGIRCVVVKHSEKSSVVIIEVTASKNKPHQYDNQYFMRVDGQTLNAPHFFIKALFNEIKYPKLHGSIELRGDKIKVVEGEIKFGINLFVSNKTKYINEEDLKISIVVNNTYQEFKNRHYDVLHFGQNIIEVIQIAIKLEDIWSDKISLQILYGGKKSPLVCSRYLYKLRKYTGYEDVITERLCEFIELTEISREVSKFVFDLDDKIYGSYV